MSRINTMSVGDLLRKAQEHIAKDELSAAEGLIERAIEKERAESMLALWFTPDAIADHWEGDPSDYADSERAEWVQQASIDELISVGQDAIGDDMLYQTFHEILGEIVDARIGAEA